MIARAKRDALRSAVLDDWLERRVCVERSFRQMTRAGQPFAMVPRELAAPNLVADVVANLDRAPLICGVVLEEEAVAWVCLAPFDAAHPSCREQDRHAWPAPDIRERSTAALVEQVDPIARIERRVAYALEGPAAHPLLADMPTA